MHAWMGKRLEGHVIAENSAISPKPLAKGQGKADRQLSLTLAASTMVLRQIKVVITFISCVLPRKVLWS